MVVPEGKKFCTNECRDAWHKPALSHLQCPNCEQPFLQTRRTQKYCSEKCRNSWHAMYREDEPRNTRIQFALTVLRFMEKQFPDQTAKMRQGFEKKRREKDG